ncbi:MAG: hypothetical protein WA949_10770 [Phormidesmis sp.]
MQLSHAALRAKALGVRLSHVTLRAKVAVAIAIIDLALHLIAGVTAAQGPTVTSVTARAKPFHQDRY